MVKSILRKLPGIRELVQQRDRLAAELKESRALQSFPAGHYYSPIADPEEVRGLAERTGSRERTELPGIDLGWDRQEQLVQSLTRFYGEMPFGDTDSERGEYRYYFENGFYSYTDGILLYLLLRHLEPARLIEVGSGFSSCLTLDVNQHCFSQRMHCTFIEPYPDRLFENMKPADREAADVLQQKVQSVDPELFQTLGENDILFIDSSHVSKAASDVNYLFLEILPQLKKGVWVHVHDVFYPFEYPEKWILSGRSWNEAYLLRCLLMFSSAFEIQLWGDALCAHKAELMTECLPKCLRNSGGGIWLRKTS